MTVERKRHKWKRQLFCSTVVCERCGILRTYIDIPSAKSLVSRKEFFSEDGGKTWVQYKKIPKCKR